MKRLLDWTFDRYDEATRARNASWGLLVLRVAAGTLMLGHGWPKLAGFAERAANFPDPLGVGSPVSLGLTVFAEFVCALMVVVGFKTRFAVIPLTVTMLVAAFVIHGQDPWSKQEFPLLYAVIWTTLLVTGAGRYSLDSWLFSKRNAPLAE